MRSSAGIVRSGTGSMGGVFAAGRALAAADAGVSAPSIAWPLTPDTGRAGAS